MQNWMTFFTEVAFFSCRAVFFTGSLALPGAFVWTLGAVSLRDGTAANTVC